MSAKLECVRCGREAEPLPMPPMRGPLGLEIRAKVCPACWAEWQKAEVMVINELRLNFMDPAAQEILTAHLREFLCLDGRPPAA
jgi:Fe-S cluster biosynthesis and repair protein YggX